MKKLFLLLLLSLGLIGLVNADFNDGWVAYKKGDYKTAYKEWLPLAEQGNMSAQHNIGHLHFNGLGVTKDERKARSWYRKAAEQGYGGSQEVLGDIYLYGWGALSDYEKAMYWYKKASAQGKAEATHGIAILHFHGLGVYESRANAAKWMEKAAEQGSVIAQFRIGLMYAKGDGVAQNYQKAKKWLNLAHDNASSDDKQNDKTKRTLIEDIESAWNSLQDGSYDRQKIPVRLELMTGSWF